MWISEFWQNSLESSVISTEYYKHALTTGDIHACPVNEKSKRNSRMSKNVHNNNAHYNTSIVMNGADTPLRQTHKLMVKLIEALMFDHWTENFKLPSIDEWLGLGVLCLLVNPIQSKYLS